MNETNNPKKDDATMPEMPKKTAVHAQFAGTSFPPTGQLPLGNDMGYKKTVSIPKKPKQPFNATKTDGILLLACMIIGILFYRLLGVTYIWQGWGVAVFTVVYTGSILLYTRSNKIKPAVESWFWLGVLLLTAISYALWPRIYFDGVRWLFLIFVAIYWCGTLFGITMEGKTGNYILLDTLNVTLCVPIKNLRIGFESVKTFFNHKNEDKKTERKKTLIYILLGVAITLPIIAFVYPLLLAADSGVFSSVVENAITSLSDWLGSSNLINPAQYLTAFVVGIYVFSLVGGAAHRRYAQSFNQEKTQTTVKAMHVLPAVSAIVVLCAIILLYILFIGCQIPYFFSAFQSTLPEGVSTYSEYARQGFFELCAITAFNLALIAALKVFTKAEDRQRKILRVQNLLMVAINLLLIVTAFEKMGLYIEMYGLTPKRFITSIFMIYLACICIAVAVLQFKRFSIMRVTAMLGSVIACFVFLANINGYIVEYNASRYLEGALARFDTAVLYNGTHYLETAPMTSAGLDKLNEIYESEAASNTETSREIAAYLSSLQRKAQALHGTHRDTYLYEQVRQKGYFSDTAAE